MTHRPFTVAWLAPCALLLFATACGPVQDESLPPEATGDAVATAEPLPEKLEVEGFQAVLARTGDVYVSGQPSREALDWLQSRGVTTVVNLRTQPEMDDRDRVPYDEAAALDSLGIQYVHIPLGGEDAPYTPEAVERFAEAVDAAEGKVLLHCTVAWRASHMWVAYLVRHRGMALDEAIAHGEAINLGTLPIEGLLGAELTYAIE
ncbi:MAG: sulfur transferase domain-containing protein [Gemmatimonadota bacterium]